jgi:hypothetical protein
MFEDLFEDKPKQVRPKRRIEDPREFLTAVMNEDPEVMNSDYLAVRLRAAVELLAYTHPKLGITAVVSQTDFAALLDQRLKRIAETKLIEGKPTNGGSPKPTQEVEVKVNRGAVDRRWRRI